MTLKEKEERWERAGAGPDQMDTKGREESGCCRKSLAAPIRESF